VFTRDNQDMDRRLRADVPEGHGRVVLVNNVSLDIAFDNAAEKTLVHCTPFRRTPVRLRMDLDSTEKPLSSPLVILSPSPSVILSEAKNLVFSKTWTLHFVQGDIHGPFFSGINLTVCPLPHLLPRDNRQESFRR